MRNGKLSLFGNFDLMLYFIHVMLSAAIMIASSVEAKKASTINLPVNF
jgi:hypothetical protein